MSRVGVVIVTFNNAKGLAVVLAGLANQTRKPERIFVVDNSTLDLAAVGRGGDIEYILLDQNQGSAGGYHEGIKAAAAKSDLIWLLDDDVRINADALEKLLVCLDTFAGDQKAGALRSWCSDSRPPSPTAYKTDSFAWRGTLIKKEVVEKIGLPRKEFFLYADDWEYSLRMRDAGFDIYWVGASRVIEERQEDKACRRILGKRTTIYHDPAKLYYAFRNQIYLCREYRLWGKFLSTLMYAVKVSVFSLFSDNKLLSRRIAAIGNGLSDGLSAKLGKNLKYIPYGEKN